MKKFIIVLLILLAALTAGYIYLSKTPSQPTAQNVPPASSNEAAETPTKNYDFDELGISLSIPENLYVIKTPNYNPETDELESYNFFIQNYCFEGGPATGDLQIYGLYQFDLPETTPEELAKIKEDTQNYSYIKEFTAGPLSGYETRQNGERTNYVYMLLLNGRVLKISVSEPTETNKLIAEKILKSLRLKEVQSGTTDSMDFIYSIDSSYKFVAPKGWTINKDSNSTSALSPDYKLSEGYPVLEAGAEISVLTKPLNEALSGMTINEILASNPITTNIPNKVSTTVAGINAVRYELSYEGVEAVMTEFIKDNVRYTIRLRFSNEWSKNANMDNYEAALATFGFVE